MARALLQEPGRAEMVLLKNLPQPVRRLRGFQRVALTAGQLYTGDSSSATRHDSFTVTPR